METAGGGRRSRRRQLPTLPQRHSLALGATSEPAMTLADRHRHGASMPHRRGNAKAVAARSTSEGRSVSSIGRSDLTSGSRGPRHEESSETKPAFVSLPWPR